MKLWDTAAQQELVTLKVHPEVTSVAFSPDGKTLAAGSTDKTIKLWIATIKEDVAAQTK